MEDDDDANAGPVDSDEETAAVMGALARWNPCLYSFVYPPRRHVAVALRLWKNGYKGSIDTKKKD